MKSQLLAGLFLIGGISHAAAAALPPFHLVRADEDYGSLSAAPRDSFDTRIKYLPLGDGVSYASFGGEWRERFDHVSASAFGVGGKAGDDYLLQRLLVHADLHIGHNVRLFAELGLHHAFGKMRPTAPPDRDDADIQVAFGELATTDKAWRLRVGRQEFRFTSSQRFLSVREGPNVRRSFDGVRLTGKAGPWQMDAFAVRPVEVSLGAFDDATNRGEGFYGLFVRRGLSVGEADVYWYGYERDRAQFGTLTAVENRQSAGMRLAGKRNGFDWDAEGVLQWGHFGPLAIRAWGFGLDGGYTLHAAWAPRLGFRFDGGSGDSDPDDGKLETFNPVFPKGAYFNEAGFTSYANLLAARVSMRVHPRRGLALEVAAWRRWRQTAADAIYLQPYRPLPALSPSVPLRVGDVIQLDATWHLDRNIKLQGELVHQGVTAAVRSLGGRPVDFAMLVVQYRF